MGAGKWDGKESSSKLHELDVSNFNWKPLKGPVLGRDQIYLKKKRLTQTIVKNALEEKEAGG